MIDYINARCLAWAEYSRRRVTGKLGYPKQSAFARLMPSGTCSVPIDEDEVSEIERAIVSLDRDLIRVIRSMYLESGTVSQKAKDCHVCRDTYYTQLHRAHVRIMEWLQDHDPEDRRQKRFDSTSDTRVLLSTA